MLGIFAELEKQDGVEKCVCGSGAHCQMVINVTSEWRNMFFTTCHMVTSGALHVFVPFNLFHAGFMEWYLEVYRKTLWGY